LDYYVKDLANKYIKRMKFKNF